MEVLEKAAAKNHPESLNTVGWHALEIERNFSKAAQFFERSYDLGNKDAAYNLAHMYLRGLYPNTGIDRVCSTKPHRECVKLIHHLMNQ